MILKLSSLLLKRASSLLLLSFFSLCIGGFLFGGVLTLTSSISTYLLSEGKTLIGGDIVMSSPYPIDLKKDIFTVLEAEGHRIKEVRSFQGVFTTAENSSPAQIRAVSEEFPFYGKVLVEGDVPFGYEPLSLYAEESFLSRMGLSVGDGVDFAGKKFTVKGVLLKEPDTISVGISLAPKVIIFLPDIKDEATALSESRTRYTVYIKENELLPISTETRASLKTYATENRLRFDDALDGPNNLLDGFSAIDDFIGIILAVALFLVVINIGANLVYLLSRFRKTIALLKIYGAPSRSVEIVFLLIFGLTGFVAGLFGAYVGVLVARYVLEIVNTMYTITLSSSSLLPTMFLGGVFGSVFIVLASLPFLYLVKKVEPKELLLNQMKTKSSFSFVQVLLHLPIPLFVGVTLYGISRNALISVFGIVTCIFVFILFMAIVYALLKVAYRYRDSFSFLWRSITSFLYLRKLETLVSVAAIMTAFSLVFVVVSVRHNIETNVRTNINTSAPSMYLIDITASQIKTVEEIVGPSFKEYPVVRGRLLYVNNRNLLEENNRELRREFSLTYRDALIDGEKVVEGVFGDTQNGSVKNPVSIDASFAKELGGAKIGDTIEILIQGVEIKATITSVRETDSRSGTPFFYLVFPTQVLSSFPATFFATADVSDTERKIIERALAEQFPNVIPIVTSSIVSAVTELVENLVKVIALVSIPSIVLGLLLIVVMLSQNMYERSADVLVLRVFGLSRKRVTILFLMEGVVLVSLAGLLSYGIAHLIAWGLNEFLFSFTVFSFALSPLLIIVGNIVVVSVISYILSRNVATASLKKLLAEK